MGRMEPPAEVVEVDGMPGDWINPDPRATYDENLDQYPSPWSHTLND